MNQIDRRDLLKKAGLGSLALAGASTLGQLLAAPAAAQPSNGGGHLNFYFVAFSLADTIDGVSHRIAMEGDGIISPGHVVGGGAFVHHDAASPIPQTVLGTGSWRATRLISFEIVGTWGVAAAGILVMEIDLVPEGGKAIPAHLEIYCNIGPAGIFTGQPEGYKLTVPGAPFGPFEPLVPPLGLTVFTTVNERRGASGS